MILDRLPRTATAAGRERDQAETQSRRPHAPSVPRVHARFQPLGLMIHRMRWIALLVLAAACGDNVPAIPFESYATARRHAECERQVRCGLFATIDACEAYTYLIPDHSLEAAIADGRVVYSEAAALRCTNALAAITCDGGTAEARDEPEVCAGVFRGTRATGASCAFDAECASQRCMQAVCDPSTCCPGMCVEQSTGAIGSSCALDRDCNIGAYCALDHTCHALGKTGESCFRDSQCAAALGCVATTNPGVCGPLAPTGAACPDGKCALIGERCDATMKCVADGLPGSSCSRDSDCSPTGYCSAGSCADLPHAGMPCTSRCSGDAWCDVTTQMCRDRKNDNAPCGTDFECITGYCAEGVAFDYCAERPVCS